MSRNISATTRHTDVLTSTASTLHIFAASSLPTSSFKDGLLDEHSAFICSAGVGFATLFSGLSLTSNIRNMCHFSLRCSELGSTHGNTCPSRFLRMHHLPGLYPHNRNMVSKGRTLISSSLLVRNSFVLSLFMKGSDIWIRQSANAGFGIIADLVNYGIGDHAEKHGGLAPWRGISLFLGAATLLASMICFLLLGSPKEVRWMDKEEKRMA